MLMLEMLMLHHHIYGIKNQQVANVVRPQGFTHFSKKHLDDKTPWGVTD